MKYILIITLFVNLLLADLQNIKSEKIEYIYFNNVINKIHNILKNGEGYPDDLFIDELEKRREGHCGHFSLFFFRELIMHDYSVEIINITTFDNRIHNVVQVKLKSSDRYIVVDPTSKIIYKNSIGELIANPSLSNNKIGNSEYEVYTSESFWKNIKFIKFDTFIEMQPINKFRNIILNKEMFYESEIATSKIIDEDLNTYISQIEEKSKNAEIKFDFYKMTRLSSILIYPYDILHYPKKIKLICDDKLIYDNEIELKRGLIVVNFFGNDYCQQLDFIFSDFQGQDRLLLRDIYIYGK